MTEVYEFRHRHASSGQPRPTPPGTPRSRSAGPGATSKPMGWARNVFGIGRLLGLLPLPCWRCGGRRHRSREFTQQGERSLRWT